eukprot:1188397-Prorocentrum_minimum.AAC.3
MQAINASLAPIVVLKRLVSEYQYGGSRELALLKYRCRRLSMAGFVSARNPAEMDLLSFRF